MAKQQSKPTDAELEILQVLWKDGPNSVRYVNTQLNKMREVGYTTTLKMMQIMVEKGLLERNTSSRSHIYASAISEETTQHSLVNKLVKQVFQGSPMRLVLQALGNHKASKAELSEIKALIKKMEEE
ncbi:MAG: BlaI/MecI/CopY family transcriptional regulator [Bacteroidota bacterium]